MSGFLNNSSNSIINELFSKTFPELGLKSKYCTNFGILGLIFINFRKLLIDSLKVSEWLWFVISFSENLNDLTHSSEMDLLVCYF